MSLLRLRRFGSPFQRDEISLLGREIVLSKLTGSDPVAPMPEFPLPAEVLRQVCL